jgi:hypothetical protein
MHSHLYKIFGAAGIAVLIVTVALNWNCGTGFSFKSLDEGKIIYDVTFPFDADNPYINIYPKEMIFLFKDGKVKLKLASFAEVVTSEFLIDNNDKTFCQYFKVFDDKYQLKLDNSGVQQMVNTLPPINLKSSETTDSLAGMLCNTTIAAFMNHPEDSILLYHTSAIDIDTPNWCNQYNAIPEVLMAYELEQFGKRMRLTAREISYEEVSDEEFLHQEGFKDVSMNEMKLQIENLLADFNN